MSQAFYRKWRPQKWDEVVSQEHVVQTLRNAVKSGRTGHAYLMAGPRGTGKTTTARLLAKALNCLDKDPAQRPCDECEHCRSFNAGTFLDLIEIDAASNTSVDDVRDLREKINFRPTQGEYKVYIIDEVHMLSTAAFNALLKTLEEPPPHAIFILATTEVHKIPATILSRCQRYEFRRIPVEEIARHLRAMATEEGLEVEEEALTLIARQATGAMRDAISLLDQLASTGGKVTLQSAQEVLGTATSGMVIDLIESVLEGNAGRGLKIVQGALDAGTDPRQFSRQIVDYLRNVMLVKMGNANQVEATQEMRAQLAAHALKFEMQRLLEAIRLFNAAATDTRSSWHPGLALELAMAEAVEQKPVVAAPTAAKPVETSHPAGASQPAPSQPAYTPPPAVRNEPAAVRNEPPIVRNEPPASQPVASKEPPAASQSAAGAAPDSPAPDTQASAASSDRAAAAEELKKNWARIRQMVKRRNAMTEGLLNSARSVVLKDNTLILGFQTEVVKSKMETPENLELIRQSIQSILGIHLAVRCYVMSGKNNAPADMDVDSDSMVGTALDLGGKIVYKE